MPGFCLQGDLPHFYAACSMVLFLTLHSFFAEPSWSFWVNGKWMTMVVDKFCPIQLHRNSFHRCRSLPLDYLLEADCWFELVTEVWKQEQCSRLIWWRAYMKGQIYPPKWIIKLLYVSDPRQDITSEKLAIRNCKHVYTSKCRYTCRYTILYFIAPDKQQFESLDGTRLAFEA